MEAAAPPDADALIAGREETRGGQGRAGRVKRSLGKVGKSRAGVTKETKGMKLWRDRRQGRKNQGKGKVKGRKGGWVSE